MAYTTIKKPSDYFNTILTAGGAQSITGVGFQPDLVWNKRREDTSDHYINDAVRGATKILFTNQTVAEQTSANFMSSFDSDGFTTGSGYWNSGASIVAWNWLASNTTASNTDGSITSTVSANTTSGFSIVKYTGTASASTVGHGLGTIPSCYIVKNLSDTAGQSWNMYHHKLDSTPQDFTIFLNSTSAKSDEAVWNDTAPTSSVFSIGTARKTNFSGDNYIAYCFAEKKGFSKFGSYTGNGSTDGTFVYTGFKPAFVIRKNANAVTDWRMDDNKRPGYNVIPYTLFPNLNNAETTSSGYYVDLLSNGFKVRGTSVNQNTSGQTYIYMAFAEEPLVGDNPATAR